MSRPNPRRAGIAWTMLVLASACLASCGDPPAPIAPRSASVIVHDGWARPTVAAQTTAAVYFDLIGARHDDVLTGVAVPSSIAGAAELHQTMSGNGSDPSAAMTMGPVSTVDVPAGRVIRFSPGGYHVMLRDLVAPIREGTTFTLTLRFRDSGTEWILVAVDDRL